MIRYSSYFEKPSLQIDVKYVALSSPNGGRNVMVYIDDREEMNPISLHGDWPKTIDKEAFKRDVQKALVAVFDKHFNRKS